MSAVGGSGRALKVQDEVDTDQPALAHEQRTHARGHPNSESEIGERRRERLRSSSCYFPERTRPRRKVPLPGRRARRSSLALGEAGRPCHACRRCNKLPKFKKCQGIMNSPGTPARDDRWPTYSRRRRPAPPARSTPDSRSSGGAPSSSCGRCSADLGAGATCPGDAERSLQVLTRIVARSAQVADRLLRGRRRPHLGRRPARSSSASLRASRALV
jgi:hypothetical protein